MSLKLLELTATMNMSELKPASARRCLFGKTNSEKLDTDFENAKQEDNKRFRERWSFDPITGPIESGKYQFEVIGEVNVPSDTVPSFYTKGYHRRPRHRSLRDKLVASIQHPGRAHPAKRKLELDNSVDENNENDDISSEPRVPIHPGFFQSAPTMKLRAPSSIQDSPSSGADSSDGDGGRLSGDEDRLFASFTSGFTSLCPSSVHALLPGHPTSPSTRSREIMTPPSNRTPRHLVQKSMKDFLSNKKVRGLFSTKTLPRT